MTLLRFDKVSLAFGLQPLLDEATFSVEGNERVCLIGRNGAGKSSLFSLVTGLQQPDSGQVWVQPGVRVGYLPQDLPDADDRLVYDVVADGLPEVGQYLREYHHLLQQKDQMDMDRLGRVQQQLEALDGWAMQQKVDAIITRLELPGDKRMSELSGGWRRRVVLGRALVSSPDILLLDEPTNHLDIPAIQWLEKQLLQFNGALLFITHDRSFLRRMATRLLELDRGHLTSWPGNYDRFLERKEAWLAEEQRHNDLFDKKLAQEEVWIRQGIKARRTRNEGRVRALQSLREERTQRRELQGKVRLGLDEARKSGKLVVEAEHMEFAYPGVAPVIRDFSGVIMRGDRIGLVGKNGAGKTTFLKLILGQLEPTSGSIRHGTKLEVAYFDQLRGQLDLEKTVIENLDDGREFIEINGQQRHVIAYLEDFLFPRERMRTPVKALSGGETNRLLLAKLFSKPANTLVLDEPTNDLDIETLELLEGILLQFQGTVLLVSHDREFLNNVVTSTVVFTGNGSVEEFVGGFDDWIRQGGGFETLEQPRGEPEPVKAKAAEVPSKAGISAPMAAAPATPRKKLSYKLQRELEQLPGQIETLEAEQAALQQQTQDSAFYQRDPVEVTRILNELAELESRLNVAMERWLELEAEQQ